MILVAVCLFDIPTSQKSTWNTESKRQKNCSSISECGMFCLFLDVDVQLLFHTRLSFINRKIACRYSKWLPEENKYYDGNRIWRMINVVWNWVPKIFCLAHHSIDHNLNYTMFGKKKKNYYRRCHIAMRGNFTFTSFADCIFVIACGFNIFVFKHIRKWWSSR